MYISPLVSSRTNLFNRLQISILLPPKIWQTQFSYNVIEQRWTYNTSIKKIRAFTKRGDQIGLGIMLPVVAEETTNGMANFTACVWSQISTVAPMLSNLHIYLASRASNWQKLLNSTIT